MKAILIQPPQLSSCFYALQCLLHIPIVLHHYLKYFSEVVVFACFGSFFVRKVSQAPPTQAS